MEFTAPLHAAISHG